MKRRLQSDDHVRVDASDVGRSRPSRRYPRGRICAYHDCRTELSIYNQSSYCSLHEQGEVPRMRGKGIES